MKWRNPLKILNEPDLFNAISRAGVLGMHMVSGLIVGGLIGYGLDSYFETGPLWLIVFLILGICAGFRNLYLDAKLLLLSQKKPENQPAQSSDAPEANKGAEKRSQQD